MLIFSPMWFINCFQRTVERIKNNELNFLPLCLNDFVYEFHVNITSASLVILSLKQQCKYMLFYLDHQIISKKKLIYFLND